MEMCSRISSFLANKQPGHTERWGKFVRAAGRACLVLSISFGKRHSALCIYESGK